MVKTTFRWTVAKCSTSKYSSSRTPFVAPNESRLSIRFQIHIRFDFLYDRCIITTFLHYSRCIALYCFIYLFIFYTLYVFIRVHVIKTTTNTVNCLNIFQLLRRLIVNKSLDVRPKYWHILTNRFFRRRASSFLL